MKRIGMVAGLALLASQALAQAGLPRKTMQLAETQATLLLQQTPLAIQRAAAPGKSPLVSPRSRSPKGELVVVPTRDWTSGFFPGYLWLLFQATGQAKWQAAAQQYTARIEPEKANATSHDVGFKVYDCFGPGYRLTQDAHYRDVIIEAARTLTKRFSPQVGAIRSWDHHRELWGYPVIIDNMLNLELLFAATRLSGDSSFYKIAVAHANTTLKKPLPARLQLVSRRGLRLGQRPRGQENHPPGLRRCLCVGAGPGLGALWLHHVLPRNLQPRLPSPGRACG
jgi:unsaturated chondroitin disaccharide hydrolase